MRPPRRSRRRPLCLAVLFGLAVPLLLLLTPLPASAHPLDVYLQATYLTVEPSDIVVELDLTPGVLVAPQVLSQLDIDGDQQISDAEGRAYVDAALQHVVLRVDGEPLALAVTKVELPAYLNVQTGYGTIRVFTTATAAHDLGGTHQISFENDFAPTGSAYQVNAFVENGGAVTLGPQARDASQQRLTVDVTVDAGSADAVTAVSTTDGTGGSSGDAGSAAALTTTARASTGGGRLLGELARPTLAPGVLLVALGLAVVLGGLHALTPGHGKTLVAAYLVGNRGTVRHTVILGAIVTVTHTVSVIAIGLLAVFASQFIVPDVLAPALEILSGVLVVAMGARLARRRWTARRRADDHTHGRDDARGHVPARGHAPDHDQAHDDSHVHTGDHVHARDDHDHAHSHGRHSHTHLTSPEGVTMGSLAALGVSGGLVPCPEALGVMVLAVGLNRILLGLGLIVSFSLGLAAVLIGLGVVLVRSRSLVERFARIGGRWTSSALPLVSAVVVTILGAGIAARGLGSLPLPA